MGGSKAADDGAPVVLGTGAAGRMPVTLADADAGSGSLRCDALNRRAGTIRSPAEKLSVKPAVGLRAAVMTMEISSTIIR